MSESVKTVVHLNEAIDKLRAFTGPAASTVGRTGNLFRSRDLAPPQGTRREEILNAIEVIHRNLNLLERLNAGSESQKKLAASAIAVIERYNEALETMRPKRSLFREILRKFLPPVEGDVEEQHLPKIHLPSRIGPESHLSLASMKISQVAAGKRQVKMHPISGLTRQAADLFYMKSISMLENALAFSNTTAREIVSNAIIEVALIPENERCRVSCCIHLPGEPALTISGDFTKLPKGIEYDFPLRDSFVLTR